MALKHLIILFALCLFLITLASPRVAGSFTDEWGEYQDDPSNRGFVHDETGHFTSDLGITYTDSNDGMNFQPLIVNMTGDEKPETVIYSGNFLQMYDEQMNLIDETNIGAIEGQPIIYNNGSVNIVVAISGDVLEAWSYNGTDFVDEFANDSMLNSSWNCDTWTGIKCSGNICRTLCDNSTETFVLIINMTSATWTSTTLSPDSVRGVPAVADMDRDGDEEIMVLCDADGDASFGICAIDTNGTGTPHLDTGFSGDGILDDIDQINGRISNPIFWNLDGAGDIEVLLSTTTGTDDLAINAYRSDGTALWSDSYVVGTSINTVSQPVIVDNGNLESQWDVCSSGVPNLVGTIFIICSDNDGVTLDNFTVVYLENGGNGIPIIAADMDNDNVDELVISGGLIETNGTIIVNTTSDNDFYISIADVNGDTEPEIIVTQSGETRIIYSDFANDPPEINNTQNFGGYGGSLDYTTPICVGSTLTFIAQECGGIATCNYDNDGASDTERIVSNCGQLASGEASTSFTNNLANGTFHGARPTFQCVYNLTGIFSVRLFLQDNFNDDDFTEFNTETITVQVINGTAGITCNLGSAVSPGDTGGIVPSAQESQTNQAVDDTLGILFGSGSGSDKLKLIVGIALILGIIVAAVREGIKSPAGIAIVAGMATLLVTMIGLVTPAIFILGLALVLLVLFIGRSLNGGAPAGE